jgi:hypothetical protein
MFIFDYLILKILMKKNHRHHHPHSYLIVNKKEHYLNVLKLSEKMMVDMFELIESMLDFVVVFVITFVVFHIDYNELHCVLLDEVVLEDDDVLVLIFHVQYHPMHNKLY